MKSSDTNALHGLFSIYNENGQILCTREYMDGKLNGEVIWYFSNGKISNKLVIRNEVRDGWEIAYYPNGQIFDSILFVAGGIWSIACMYDSLGQPLNYGTLHNGNGLVRLFNPDNGYWRVGPVVNGRRNGEWKVIYSDGIELGHRMYEDGYYIDNGVKELQREEW